MPVSSEEKRISFSSGENDAPPTATVFMNCSIVYCFDGRGFAKSDVATSVARRKRRSALCRIGRVYRGRDVTSQGDRNHQGPSAESLTRFPLCVQAVVTMSIVEHDVARASFGLVSAVF